MIIANIFSSWKARCLSILTPFKMQFWCILSLPISNFLDVGKYLSGMICNERQHINDELLQIELCLVTVLLGGCNVEEKF